MPTSISSELRRYRSLTIALMVGIIASVTVFTMLLSLDMEKTRGDMQVRADLYAARTEDRINAAITIVATEIEFLQLSDRLPSERQKIFIDRTVNDLRLDSVLEQVCIFGIESGETQYKLRPAESCPDTDLSYEQSADVRIVGRSKGTFYFAPSPGDTATGKVIVKVDVDPSRRAVFDVRVASLLVADKSSPHENLHDTTYSCLYWRGPDVPLNLGCSSAPDDSDRAADPSELLSSSRMSYEHAFIASGFDWQFVTVLRGSAIARSISIFPAIALIFLLLSTAFICYFIYQATDKNLQLRRRQTALRRTMRELEERNVDLEQFTYMASHDLQTPVRHVIYRGTMLTEDLDAGAYDSARENALKLIAAGDHMQALLLDLLQFCSAGESNLESRAVDTKALVERSVAMIRDTHNAQTVKFEMGTLPTVQTDELKLELIFQNLLENAVKFRRPDVSPLVSIGAEWDAPNSRWVFHVRDNGIGISDENIERIFIPFKQLKKDREYGGTGVGLAIVRKLVERLGGTIRAQSVPGRGTTFFFSLPVTKASSASADNFSHQ